MTTHTHVIPTENNRDGRWLKEWREAHRVTSEALAFYLGKSTSWVTNVGSGIQPLPDRAFRDVTAKIRALNHPSEVEATHKLARRKPHGHLAESSVANRRFVARFVGGEPAGVWRVLYLDWETRRTCVTQDGVRLFPSFDEVTIEQEVPNA